MLPFHLSAAGWLLAAAAAAAGAKSERESGAKQKTNAVLQRQQQQHRGFHCAYLSRAHVRRYVNIWCEDCEVYFCIINNGPCTIWVCRRRRRAVCALTHVQQTAGDDLTHHHHHPGPDDSASATADWKPFIRTRTRAHAHRISDRQVLEFGEHGNRPARRAGFAGRTSGVAPTSPSHISSDTYTHTGRK